MKRVLIALLVVLSPAVGCSQSTAADPPPETPVEATTESTGMSIEEHNEVVSGPGSAQEKVDVICQDMHDSGAFDDGVVTPEEVGC